VPDRWRSHDDERPYCGGLEQGVVRNLEAMKKWSAQRPKVSVIVQRNLVYRIRGNRKARGVAGRPRRFRLHLSTAFGPTSTTTARETSRYVWRMLKLVIAESIAGRRDRFFWSLTCLCPSNASLLVTNSRPASVPLKRLKTRSRLRLLSAALIRGSYPSVGTSLAPRFWKLGKAPADPHGSSAISRQHDLAY